MENHSLSPVTPTEGSHQEPVIPPQEALFKSGNYEIRGSSTTVQKLGSLSLWLRYVAKPIITLVGMGLLYWFFGNDAAGLLKAISSLFGG